MEVPPLVQVEAGANGREEWDGVGDDLAKQAREAKNYVLAGVLPEWLIKTKEHFKGDDGAKKAERMWGKLKEVTAQNIGSNLEKTVSVGGDKLKLKFEVEAVKAMFDEPDTAKRARFFSDLLAEKPWLAYIQNELWKRRAYLGNYSNEDSLVRLLQQKLGR